MKKRINKEALFVLTAFIVCFSFVSFVCIAFPALKVTYETSEFIIEGKAEGLMAIFGGTVSSGSEVNNFNLLNAKFNLLSLIGYLLPLLSLLLAMFALSKKSQILYYVTAAICFIGAIITFSEATIFTAVNSISKYEVTLLFGPIMGGICGVIAGVISIGSWYVFNKK